jgi:hypothetical protein
MSKRVHIVPCGDDFPWGKLVALFLLLCGGIWMWHHVLLPIGHAILEVLLVVGKILEYGGMLVLAFCVVIALWFSVICLIERRRHRVHLRRGRRLAYLPGYRLARKNSGLALDGEATAPHQTIPARPVVYGYDRFGHPDPSIKWKLNEHGQGVPDIDSEDKTFLFLHGIKPEDIFK